MEKWKQIIIWPPQTHLRLDPPAPAPAAALEEAKTTAVRWGPVCPHSTCPPCYQNHTMKPTSASRHHHQSEGEWRKSCLQSAENSSTWQHHRLDWSTLPSILFVSVITGSHAMWLCTTPWTTYLSTLPTPSNARMGRNVWMCLGCMNLR